jgi:type I restriction enzyme, S subunit
VYSICQPTAGTNAKYYSYIVREMARTQWIAALAKGIRERSTDFRFDGFANQSVPLPPPAEQSAMVRFLDHVDRHIRRCIRAKQMLIALLNEQKQTIIQRAVTSGLDSDVPLKPSGLTWLGDLPKHWEVVSLRYLATKFGSGITPRGGAAIYQETGIPFLRSQNIHFDGLRLQGVARISSSLHEELRGTHVRSGDVLLNITGASIGRVCAVPHGFDEANVNQHVCIIRPITRRIVPRFLSACLSTSFMQRLIRTEQNGASREGLTLQAIRGFKIILPPLEEQERIVDRIREQTQEIVDANKRTEHEVALLREYRIRLFADVVTGKLDVREAAAELPKDSAAAEPLEDIEPLGEPENSDLEVAAEEVDA